MSHAFSASRSALAMFLSLVLACFALPGCSSSTASTDTVAVTVMGENIMESDVTAYIDGFRSTMGYSSDDDWADYLEDQEMTPKQLRTATIYELAGDVVLQKKADELGLSVSDEELDEQIQSFREALYATDDETWQETLEYYGTNEEDLRERYRKGLLEEKVYEEVVGDITATDQDMTSYVQEYLLGATTKKFLVIYGLGYTEAQGVLDNIKAASSVAEGIEQAKQSADGEMIIYEEYGWDIDPEVTTYMEDELDTLEVGQVSSELVSDSDVGAYEIIYVEDSYTFPTTASEVDVNAMPDGIKDILAILAADRVYSISCSSWLNEQLAANLTENEMPSGLSYDVEVNISSNTNTNASATENSNTSK